MTLEELLKVMDMSRGFYITNLRSKSNDTTFYIDADDYFERSYAKYELEKEVVCVSLNNNYINVTVK